MTRVEKRPERVVAKSDRYWSTRLLRPSDAEAMAELSRRCFGERADSIDFIRSRYTESKGPPAFVWAAEAEGELIGTQAITLLPFFVGGGEATVGMFTAGMTHPKHRKRGVFREVVEAAERFGFEQGVAGLFTMPNDESYPSFQKSKLWRTLTDRPLRAMAIDVRRLLADRGLPGFVAGIGGWLGDMKYGPRLNRAAAGVSEITDLVEIGDQLDRLAEIRGHEFGGFMCRRDHAFLRWRFTENPTYRYRYFISRGALSLDGYLVTRTETRMGTRIAHVVDWLAASGPDILESLLAAAGRAAREDGAALLTMIASGGVEVERFAAFGFHVVPTRLAGRSFHTAYAVNPAHPELHELAAKDGAWYLTLGDFDSI